MYASKSKYSIIYKIERKTNDTSTGFKLHSSNLVRATDTQLLIKRKKTILKFLAKNKKYSNATTSNQLQDVKFIFYDNLFFGLIKLLQFLINIEKK